MNGDSAYNGPTDDGATVAGFRLAQLLEAARDAHVRANPVDDGVSPLLKAMLGTGGPEATDGPPAPVQPTGGAREDIGYSFRRRRS